MKGERKRKRFMQMMYLMGVRVYKYEDPDTKHTTLTVYVPPALSDSFAEGLCAEMRKFAPHHHKRGVSVVLTRELEEEADAVHS